MAQKQTTNMHVKILDDKCGANSQSISVITIDVVTSYIPKAVEVRVNLNARTRTVSKLKSLHSHGNCHRA